MPLQFDATVKALVQTYPLDWVAGLDEPSAGPVRVLSPDLSTISSFSDMVLHLGTWLLHIDFQSGPDPDLERRLLLYNILLYERYGLPVHTVLILLRPSADRRDLTGQVRYQARSGRGGLMFDFEIVRLWQRPVEALLAGPLGMLPLAPLGQLPEGVDPDTALAAVVQQLAERIEREAAGEAGAKLLTAAYVLAGLRVSRERVVQLFQGVRHMRESTAYQAILDEGRAEGEAKGRAEEAHKLLLRLGRTRFGPPTAAEEAALAAVTGLDRLERLSDRLLEVGSWQDLLDTP
jgi:predicted transposase YdaD